MSYVRPLPPARVARTWSIPLGDAGPRVTVENMAALAWEDADAIPLRFHSGRDLRWWLAEHTYFQEDPPDLELVRTPGRMLREIERYGRAGGDCDDVATLAAALGLASGMDVRLVLAGLAPDGPFVHVFAEVREPAGPSWTELDVVAEAQGIPPGWTPPRSERFHLSPRG